MFIDEARVASTLLCLFRFRSLVLVVATYDFIFVRRRRNAICKIMHVWRQIYDGGSDWGILAVAWCL